MSKSARRFRRSMMLGVLALGVLVYTAVDQFDVPVETLLQLALGALLGALLVIIAAGASVFLWLLLRKGWRALSGQASSGDR